MKKSSLVCAMLVVVLIVTGIGVSLKKNSLTDQRAGQRWSDQDKMGQITVIYPLGMTGFLDEMYFDNISHSIQKEIDQSAFADQTGLTDEYGIGFPYSVSVTGNISIEYDGKNADTTVVGVDDSFFVFHPVNLLYGSYISGRDLMDDGIIIDDETAWILFGSSDVVGKSVNIGEVPHYIRGVVKKEEGRVAEAAGLDRSLCYVSLSSLKKYGNVIGSYVYEAVLPDPVEGFALKTLNTAMGTGTEGLEIIENTSRFDYGKCLHHISEIGIRSMSTRDILYPYYENEARAWEDVFGIIYLIQTMIVISLILILFAKFIAFRRTAVYKNFRKKYKLRAPWKWEVWGKFGTPRRRRENEKKA